MNKVYVYHHNDHDGIVAAGVLYNLYLKYTRHFNEIEFIMIDYQKELKFDHINPEDKVYFLDYSFSNHNNLLRFSELINRVGNKNIVWIDHHKTSIGILDNYNINGIRDTSLCGAAWTYIYCKNYPNCNDKYYNMSAEAYDISKEFHDDPDIPMFLKYIDDYDCWKKIYPETNDFHYGFNISDPKNVDIYILLNPDNNDYFTNGTITNIIEKGHAIQTYLKNNDRDYHVNMYGFEYTLPKEHGGYKCFCLNRKGNSLMFGDKVDEYDAVIPFYFVNGRWTYSIFTNKDNVDCSAVAKSFGGGGHLKAAGWTSDELIFIKNNIVTNS